MHETNGKTPAGAQSGKRQRSLPPLHRSWLQGEILSIATALEEVRDLIESDQQMAKAKTIDAIGLIFSAGRGWLDEVDAMDGLLPLHVIEAEAHKHRKRIIPWALDGEGGWEADGTYAWREPDSDTEIVVHPNNRWTASTGTEGHRVGDYGLISFVALMRGWQKAASGYSIAATAWSLAKRLHMAGDADA